MCKKVLTSTIVSSTILSIERRYKDMYYVTIIARRKNGKRHIQDRFNSYNLALKYVKQLSYISSKYIIEICDGRWNTLYTEGGKSN